jgi:hypothetical protein
MLRESLGALLLGQLPEPERATLQAHVDGCAECRAEMAEIAPLAGALRHVDPDRLDTTPTPPPQLGEQIIGRAVAERRSGPYRGALMVAAGIVVAVLIGGGVGFVAGSSTPGVPREPVTLVASDTAIDASATVVPHSWGVEITLDADGFAPGAVYRVVVVDDTGRAVDAGQFVGTGQARMLCNLNTSVLRAQAAGFDVLDTRGTVVLHGEL